MISTNSEPFAGHGLGLTRVIHCFDRRTETVSLLEVAANTTCSLPSCTQGPEGKRGWAEVAIVNVVVNSGIVIIGASAQGSTLYLCETHFDESGEAEADSFAELLRGGPLK